MLKGKKGKLLILIILIIAICAIGIVVTNLGVKKYFTSNSARYKTAQASTTADGKFEYVVLDDGTIEISKYVGTDAEVVVPGTIDGKTVTSIGNRAFNNCDSLINITISEGIIKIGNYVFSYSDYLSVVSLPRTLLTIGDSAFSGCDSLANILIPDSVTQIENFAFYGCDALTTIELSKNISNICSSAFASCGSLESIVVDENNQYYSSQDGILFNKLKTKLVCYPSGKKEIKYIIPNSVISIEEYAFITCSNIIELTISESVTRIGSYSFYYCDNLQKVVVPHNVENIGREAFRGCTNLTNITILSNKTNIEDYAFGGCTNLINIEIPEDLANMGNDVFSGSKIIMSVARYNNGNEFGILELPNIIQRALKEDDLLYCNESITLTNCTLNEEKTKVSVNLEEVAKGNVILTITEGKLKGLTLKTNINTYYINTAKDLWDFAEEVNSGNSFKNTTIYLTQDINVESSQENQWVPIGKMNRIGSDYYFSGIFEGNNHFIEQIYVNSDAESVGVFGMVSGTIKDLTIKNSYIQGTEEYAKIGGIAGYASEESNIINCINMSEIIRDNSEYAYGTVGGIVGENLGTVLNCSNKGSVKGDTAQLGGIVGKNQGKIENCNNFGSIENKRKNSTYNAAGTGGISGANSGNITNCYNKVEILTEGIGKIGGIVGNNIGGTICNSNNEKNISANGTIGGITGYNSDDGVIKKCINQGDISGRTACVGGIAGDTYKATIEECVNNGNINANMYVLDGYYNAIHAGGILGEASYGAKIVECDNHGNLTVNDNVGTAMSTGGIVGYCWSIDDEIQIYRCNNKGKINIESTTSRNYSVWNGGIVGRILTSEGKTSILNSNNFGNIQGYGTYVGGTVGWGSGDMEIEICFNNGEIMAESKTTYVSVGGIVGQMDGGTVSNVYNRGKLSGTSENCYYLGGIIGYNYGMINNCYNAGVVIGQGSSDTQCIGGIVGKNILSETSGVTCKVTNCYYLADSVENEFVYNEATCQTTKKTEQEMKNVNFVNLLNNNTSIWHCDEENVNDGYPILVAELKEIVITNLPDNREYNRYESFDSRGMIVTELYSDGRSEETKNYTILNGENLNCLVKEVVIQSNKNPEIKTEVEIKVAHDMNEATCTEKAKCKVEGCNYAEGEALGHTEVVDAAVAANCTEDGLTEGKHCSACNVKLVEQQVVPAKGHTEATDVSVAPTCTEAGLTEGKHCSVCNTVLVARQTIPANGHTEVIDPKIEPTDIETGLTEGKHCSVCNTVLVKQEVIPSLRVVLEKWDMSDTEEDNVTAILFGDGELSIRGTGKMKSFTGAEDDRAPWHEKYITTIKSIVLESGIEEIGAHAFYELEYIENVKLNEGLISIGNSAFERCSLDSIEIPSSVTSIGKYAFTNSGLDSVNIPKSVSVMEDAFASCLSLESVTIEEGVTNLGIGVFQFCTQLSSIEIPKSVIDIRSCAFSQCYGLVEVSISEGVINIEKGAFSECTNLQNINVAEENKNYSSENGILFNKNKTEIIKYPAGKAETNYNIPEGVTSIGSYAFSYCENLANIIIPKEVTSIGNSAFWSCDNLTIYCEEDSTAHAYAIKNNIPYELKMSITSQKYEITQENISKISPGTTKKDLMKELEIRNTKEVQLLDKKGQELQETDFVGTGTTLILKSDAEMVSLKIIVEGDATGDGKVEFADMVAVNRHKLKQRLLEGVFLKAADVTKDEEITFADIVKINAFKLHRITELF